MSYTGPLIGLATFAVIGIFHPIVIKTEYYFGTRPWWVFLLAGIGAIVGAFFIENVFAASLLGVTGFSCLWSILELFEQRQRVRKGWFPKGPGHQS
ncbi:MAG: DUF4491 family protein [Bacteroidales bacterium]|nr:DUF4491 family protein [Bacteroidales bacterium]MCI7051135.1 DUF4491 family protein [Bacteroidales bacterium]MDD6732572.1 DUF4491 family protein [Bacteroidales bacterium]MDY4557738.1 DUF4491 family protein [Alloprevotella sp.]